MTKVVVIDSAATFSVSRMRSGMLRCFAGHPRINPVFLLGQDANDIQALLSNPKASSVDALIANIDHVHEVPDAVLREIPSVLIHPRTAESRMAASTVTLDDRALVRAAADLLIRRGNTAFAYVGTDVESEKKRSAFRGDAFAAHLRRKGFDCASYAIPDGVPTVSADESAALAKWIGTLPLPCGLLAYDDQRAMAVIDACNLAHVKIPEQINLVGIDNEREICESTNPPLTSIWPDFEQLGFLAAKAMIGMLRHGPGVRTHHYHAGLRSVVERASTQDLRGGGRLVTLACRHLADHFAEPESSAETLARHLHVSRRLLDLRFAEILGRSVHAEIERLRLEKARQLLKGTDQPVNEIAAACGYGTAAAFRNAFTSATGTPPRDFRRQ